MTMPPVDANGVRDFTIKREPFRFRIDGDVFAAPAILSPATLIKLADLHGQIGDLGSGMTAERFTAILEQIGNMFLLLLPGEDGKRFVVRLKDPEAPLDLTGQVLPVIYWLLECYGLRPTVPSSDSSAGSTDQETDTQSVGDSSTAGVSPTEIEITSPSE